MKIFISWSGQQSRTIAETLRVWLPRVLLSELQAFVSSQDIEKGQRGLSVIAANLEEIDFGIVLLTKENQHAPWINFEAGALGKSVGQSRVSPVLLDLTQSDVTGPLEQFQMTSLSDKSDVWKLVADMNRLLKSPVPEEQLNVLFDAAWPDLALAVTALNEGAAPTTTRPPEEILDEILFRVRRIERRGSPVPSAMGPSGMTRDDEHRLVSAVFDGVRSRHPGDVRGGIKVSDSGAVVAISAPDDAHIDLKLLQEIADANDVRIEIKEHGVLVVPAAPESQVE